MRDPGSARLCLFDVDGTLVHIAEEVAFSEAFATLYGPGTDLSYDASITVSDTRYVGEVLRRILGRPPTGPEVRGLLAQFADVLERRVTTGALPVRAVRGASAFLDRLSASSALALSTGCIERSARLKLSRAGLNEHFRCGGFSVGERNRAEIIARAIAAAERAHGRRFPPADVILFGDGPWDLESAQMAGVRFIGINEDASAREALVTLGAATVFPDYTDHEGLHRGMAL